MGIPSLAGRGSCFTGGRVRVALARLTSPPQASAPFPVPAASPAGKNVLRGVHIPVVPGAAGQALPHPRTQAQFCEQVPARRAGFRAGIPAVHGDNGPAVPLRLVLQHGPELRPASAGDRAGQPPVADHAGHVQVLDRDHVVLADQARTGLVQEVPPLISHPGMHPGDLDDPLCAVRRPALAPGEPALPPLQLPLMPLPVPGVRDLLTRGQRGEMGQAHVYAGALARSRERHRVGRVDVECHEPAVGRVAGHGHRCRVNGGRVYVRP